MNILKALRHRPAFLAGLCFCLGLAIVGCPEQEPPPVLSACLSLDRPLLKVRGVIESKFLRLEDNGEGLYLLQTQQIVTKEETIPCGGKLRLHLVPDLEDLQPGDQIEVLGNLRSISPPSNRHERDRRARAFERGVFGRIQSGRENLTVLRAGNVSPERAFSRWRASLLEAIQTRFSPTAAEIAAPLLLGVWSSRRSEAIDLYSRTGAIHLLAVSGLHVGLIFGSLFLFLSRRTGRRKALLALLSFVLLAYSLLTGFQSPVFRAASMLALFCAGVVFRKKSDALTIWGWSALAVGWIQPLEVRGPSFQLSFAAVLAMILFTAPIRNRLRGIPRNLATALAASLAAFFSTLPILSWHFGCIPVASIPSTLALLPLLPPLLLLGTAGIFLPEAAALPFLKMFEWAQYLAEEILKSLDRLPGTPWFAPELPVAGLFLFSLGMLLYLAGMSRRTAAVSLGIGLLALLWPKPVPQELRLNLLDVGHGNAILVSLPDGEKLLFDAGSLDRPDLGRSILLPFFQGESISRLEDVVLSHADSDHWNGLPDLLSRVPAERLFAGSGVPRLLPWKVPSPVLEIENRVAFQRGPAEIVLLRPAVQPGALGNDASLCARIRYAGRTLLLCGDLEEEGIASLLESGEELGADVLLLPHHGLPCEEIPDLVEAVQPRVLLASCGTRFREEGRIPRPRNSLSLTTRQEGEIEIRISAEGKIDLWSFRSGHDIIFPQSRSRTR